MAEVIEFELSVKKLIGDLEDIKFYDLSVTQPKSDRKASRRHRNFMLLDVLKTFQQAGKNRHIVSQQLKQKKNRELDRLFEHGGNKEE